MTKLRFMQTAAALLIVCGLNLTSHAQRGREVYLGEAHVDGHADHDKISVGKSEGIFNSLQIRVDRAPIEFNRVEVHYGNGSSEDLSIKQRLRPGERTRWIDLRGHDRAISSVEFWYEKANWGSNRPRLRLYGR